MPMLLASPRLRFFNQLLRDQCGCCILPPRIFEQAGAGGPGRGCCNRTGIGVNEPDLYLRGGYGLIDRIGRLHAAVYRVRWIHCRPAGLCRSGRFSPEHFAIVPACIFAFIAAHAIGQGAVIWVYISEIFPDKFRAAGQSLGSFTHWIFAALLTTFFPNMVGHFHPAGSSCFSAG
jgi:hypothetical protein